MKQNQTKAIMAVLGAAILGGGNPIFSKIGLREIPPFSFTALRFFIALIILLPLAYKQLLKIKKEDWIKLIGVSLFATININLFVFGIRLTGASISQLIYSFVPVLVTIFSYLILKEKITNKKLLGIIVALVGTMLIVFLPVIQGANSLTGNVLGNLLILAGAICFSLYPVFSKKLQKKYSPLIITTIFALTTAAVSLSLSLTGFSGGYSWWQEVSKMALMSVLYLGIFGGAAYYLLHQYAIKHGSPIIASLILYLQPLAVFLWAAPMLGERLSLELIIGGGLILTGASLVSKTKD